MASANGIGCSAHKNEYRAGVRVEELFGQEAPDAPKFHIADIPQAPPPARSERLVAEGKQGQTAEMLFSHGAVIGQNYCATSNGLHYPPPDQREYGALSTDRVQRTFFWGSKRLDASCPLTDPNAPTRLLDEKRQQWAAQQKSITPDMYRSSNAAAGL